MENITSVKFQYSESYYKKHFSSRFYRYRIHLRNKFIYKEVIKHISSGNILEIGFGDDNLIKVFKNDFNVFGIDISEYAVKEIVKKYDVKNFKICDILKERIPFDEKFDIICAINTIEHLEDVEFALRNIFYSLKQNGIFIIYLPTQSNTFSRIQYKMLYNVEEHVFRPSIKSIKQILRRLEYTLCEEFAASFIPIKINSTFILESFNLYLGLWKKMGNDSGKCILKNQQSVPFRLKLNR